MRIGIDARELTGRPTGVGRYLSGLLRSWTELDAAREHTFVLYAHREIAALPFDLRVVAGGGGTMWEQRQLAGAIGRDSIDVLFSPAYSTPLFTGVARVVALHDISFEAHREWFGRREGFRRRVLARRSAERSRAVITISEFSRREIVTRFGVAPNRVHVVPPGIDAPAAGDEGAAGSPAGAALLFVGSIFNRRHVPDLIAAFGRVGANHHDAHLHIVGENRSHPHQDIAGAIARERLGDRIQWHEYVTDGRLRDLYRQARAFAFLSEYEGLGLTPLEALGACIPPLLLDTPVARESCGDAALYTARVDADLVAPAIERLLYDHSTRSAILAAAPSVLARYDWRRAAADTLRVLVEAR